jgi:hypothetical protein
MVHSRNFSAQDRKAFAKVAPDVVAIEEKAKRLLGSGLLGLGSSFPEFERCPVCGGNWLPTEFSHGNRRCRNCCHYERERASPEENAASLADSRAWWAQKTRGKAVA